MNYQLIILSILILISSLTIFDFGTYVIKSAPKRAFFPTKFWYIGFVCIAAIIYYHLNGNKF